MPSSDLQFDLEVGPNPFGWPDNILSCLSLSLSSLFCFLPHQITPCLDIYFLLNHTLLIVIISVEPIDRKSKSTNPSIASSLPPSSPEPHLI